MIKLVMNRKQEAILAALIVIGAIGAFLLYSGIGRSPAEPAPEPEPEPEQIAVQVLVDAAIAHCDNIDQAYYDALDSGLYQLNNPLVAVNPYGTSPLTALVLFQTHEPMRISVNVAGKTEDVSIRHTFSGFETSHIIPVYGLYPNAATLVEIIAEPLDVLDEYARYEVLSAQILIEAGGISEDFPQSIAAQFPVYETYYSEPPFYFTFMKKSAFDTNGDYRWCYQGFETIYPTRYTDYETMYIITGSFDAGDAILLEINMLGRIISAVPVDASYENTGSGVNNIARGTLYLPD